MARVLVHVGDLEHGRRQLAPAAVLLLHLLLRFATPVAAAPEVVPAECRDCQLRLGKFASDCYGPRALIVSKTGQGTTILY
jgi:hypothetical protein